MYPTAPGVGPHGPHCNLIPQGETFAKFSGDVSFVWGVEV